MKPSARPKSRRERAEASRQRVLRAARDAVKESGYHGTTMGDIAERSGLAVQTVSYFFGTKPRLMSQLATSSVENALAKAADVENEVWQSALSSVRTAEDAIDVFVEFGHRVLLDVAAILDATRVGAQTDPEMAEAHRRHEELREEFCAGFVAELGQRGWLRDDLTSRSATDLVAVLFGPDTYVALEARGWSGDRTRDSMRDVLRRVLLA